jgi:predicted transcriptional regulator
MSLALPGTVVAQRQRQAYNLVARGYSIGKVAGIVGVSEATVQKYIEAQKEELSDVIDRINRKDYAALVLTRFEQTRTEAWNLAEQAQKISDKTRALKLIMEIDIKEAAILQSLGLLEQAPKREEKTIETTIRIEDVNRVHLDALAAHVLAERMGITPEEALSMCGNSQRALAARSRVVMPSAEEIDAETIEAEIKPFTKPIDFDH